MFKLYLFLNKENNIEGDKVTIQKFSDFVNWFGPFVEGDPSIMEKIN